MEDLIKKVLDKYSRKKLSNDDLAKLIIAHIKVGIDGKKGWYLNLNSFDGQYEDATEIINEFGG
tara:strand:- start:1188 stop:1379 length:192 start_codon:yes stop_codon:yes gene_type:complete